MILVDTGPFVALADASDQHHAACLTAIQGIREPLGTVWPVVTEALQLLSDVPGGPRTVLEMVRRGAIQVVPLGVEDVPRVQELMARYRQRSISLAAAALVRVAEREGLARVFTVDRAFAVYRIGGRKAFRVIPERA
jgi:uncharacterized protein